jgi:hypothetical protein
MSRHGVRSDLKAAALSQLMDTLSAIRRRLFGPDRSRPPGERDRRCPWLALPHQI